MIISGYILLILAANDEKLLFQSDKIYTVLAVMLVIWGGTLAHIAYLHRKIARLEREIQAREGAPEA